jgi:mono/diheme cytochrome c family protein
MKTVAALLACLWLALLPGCKASAPGTVESDAAIALKKITIGGKDWKNPVPDNEAAVKTGAEHFQHHCQVCHGLDGHNTGVPFAPKMSPPVIDLGEKDVQQYSDGQLKWIIENGIRFTGMPGWRGILDDDEMWNIVRFIRHLPPKGSLGPPPVYAEAEQEHEAAEKGGAPGAQPQATPHTHTHTHQHGQEHHH